MEAGNRFSQAKQGTSTIRSAYLRGHKVVNVFILVFSDTWTYLLQSNTVLYIEIGAFPPQKVK